MYATQIRYDDELLANPHIWGWPADANPSCICAASRAPSPAGSNRYTASFEALWANARPWDCTTTDKNPKE